MSGTVSTAFIGDYNKDVHHVFQREGSMLKAGCFLKDGVVGSTAYFAKLGTGTATTKSRHGEITPMSAAHTQPSVALADFYAGDYVDKLDEAKTNIDIRMAYARTGAYALGRKVDSQITTALNGTTQSTITITVTSFAAILAGLIEICEALDDNDVPQDGMRFGALTPRMWSQAMTVEQFSSADYVGANGLPFTEGAPGHRKWKDWNGVKWCMHTGLPGKGGATANSYVWHKNAIGYGIAKSAGNIAGNEAVAADITWQGTRAAHFVNHMMSGAALLIDDTGVIEAVSNDTTGIATS